MLRLKQDVLRHSPIVSPRKACIDLDKFELSMIPDLPSTSPLQVELQPMLEQGKTQDEIFAKRSDLNNACHNNRSHGPGYKTDPSPSCILFDELKGNSNNSGGFIYEDSDIELMREALSILIDADDEGVKLSSVDQCDRSDKSTKMRHHCKKKCSNYCPYPSPTFSSNDQRFRIADHPMTADHERKVKSGVGDGTSMEHDPLLLPQVTFEDDEEFDRRTFFDQEKPDRLHYRDERGVPTRPSPHYNEPSEWLRQQIASKKISFQHSTPKNRNKIVDIRASLETKHKHWTREEDEILKLAAETELSQPIDWIQIAQDYFHNSRSATQCKNRWKNYLKPGVVRGNWKKHEDERIISMVSRGFKWVDIAKSLTGRTGEHVRERYVNVLDNKLKKTSWTPEEDRILFEHQRLWGNKWSEIRKLLPGRSDNSIKNRFHNRRNAAMRRLKREAVSKKNSGKV